MKCDCNTNTCGDKCRPASYKGCMFSIDANPYDPNAWMVTLGGMTHKVKIPKINETDTSVSTNYTNKTLVYHAEKHEDTITGEQLGDIVDVKDLRDVNYDPGLAGTCYELIFRKYSDCGEGCQSAADNWMNFNINSEGAKRSYMRYVRGANAYGCPEYLDVPTNTNQYWFAGWKTEGENKEFGYYRPESVSELPTDENGDIIVMSTGANGRPVTGPLPLQCILNNLVGNLGIEVIGSFSVLQQTPQFFANFNNITGDFTIEWNDWYYSFTQHVGTGHITGKMNWTSHFDVNTGKMQYVVRSVDFYDADWTVDQGAPTTAEPIFLTFKGVSLPSGTETTLINAYEYNGRQNWHIDIDRTIESNFTVNLDPNESVGPLNFSYIYVDWEGSFDDEGYLQVSFKNKIQGWLEC